MNIAHGVQNSALLPRRVAVRCVRYTRPISNRMIKMISTIPSPPLGPYPHPRLCGHAGIAPISNKITMINSMVPSVMLFSLAQMSASIERCSLGIPSMIETAVVRRLLSC